MSDVILLDKEFKDLNTKGMLQSLVEGAGKYLYFRDLGHGYRVVKKLTGQDNQEAYVKVPQSLFIESGYFRDTLAKEGVTQTVVNTFTNKLKKEMKMETTNKEAAKVEAVDQTVQVLPEIDVTADDLLKATRNKIIVAGAMGGLVTAIGQSLILGNSLTKGIITATVSTVGGAAVGFGIYSKIDMPEIPSMITAFGLGSAFGSVVQLGARLISPNVVEQEEQEWTGEMDYSMMPAQAELPAV